MLATDSLNSHYPMQATDVRQLKTEGVVLTGLALKPRGELFGDRLFELTPERGDLPFHKFDSGDPILISIFADPDRKRSNFDGDVFEEKPRKKGGKKAGSEKSEDDVFKCVFGFSLHFYHSAHALC